MRSLCALVFLSSLTALTAQDSRPSGGSSPAPSSIFPDRYTVYAALDAKELRGTCWFRAAEKTGVLAAHLSRLLEKTGLKPEDLDHIVLAGSGSDWSRLAVVLEGSTRLDARAIARRLPGETLRAEPAHSFEILVPRSGGRTPAMASLGPGTLALAPAELLRAAAGGRQEGAASEFLAASLPESKATIVAATSEGDALADVSKLLELPKAVELTAISVTASVAPALSLAVRVRVLEERSTPLLLERVKGLFARLSTALSDRGWKASARLLRSAEITRQGSMVVAAMTLEGEPAPESYAQALLEEAARAFGPAPTRPSPSK